MHDIRTRFSGYKTFIEFHLELDGNLSVNAAHDVTEDLEESFINSFLTLMWLYIKNLTELMIIELTMKLSNLSCVNF